MQNSVRQKHDWSLPEERSGRLVVEDENEYLNASTYAPVLGVYDAERLVGNLQKFSIDEVGSSKYLSQHVDLMKLNLQAHHSCMTRSDEFVLEAIGTFDKLGVLLHELILIEAWKEFILPELLLMDGVQSGERNMRIYFTLYNEAVIANLLEAAMFHRHLCVDVGNDLVDLVDYCVRKIILLNCSRCFADESPQSKDIQVLTNLINNSNPLENHRLQANEIEFRTCIAAVSIMRYLCEYIDDGISLSAVSRILDMHDVLLGIIPLIENPPWTRRLESGKWQKFIDFRWTDVQTRDLLKLTRTEGQVWLTLYYLLTSTECRRKYQISGFRKSALLRIRRFINPILLDQLPVLADIQRFMDELAIADVPLNVEYSSVAIEQVPQVRDSIISKKDWKGISIQQMEKVFCSTDSTDDDLRKIGKIYGDDNLEAILDPLYND